MLYERLCRFSERFTRRSDQRQGDKELRRAVKFLAPMMSLTIQGVKAAAYLTSVLFFVSLTVLLFILGLSLFIVIPLSAMVSIIALYIVQTYPISVMNSYKLGLSEEADLVFEQFILVFQSGGTIFDAIEMVAQSEHPYLSKAFRQMIVRINEGTPPETCLMDFAKDQPSDDLRRYFMAILSSLEKKTDLIETLSGESFEADLALRQKNLELESRLLIVAALVTYVPIMFTLAASLAGFSTNFLILLMVPVFVTMNALLKSRFSRQFSAYFDRPRDDTLIPPSQKEIITEYDEFLNFLMLLGERLSTGDTLEVALPNVRDDLDPEAQRLVDIAIKAVYADETSITEAMNIASKSALGQRVSQMFNMIALMCETSATDAGIRISKITSRLVKRSAVAKERDSIIAAQRMKVYLLTLTSAAVLGMLASLAPFLYLGALLTQGPTWTPGSISTLDIIPLLITLGITTLSTGYQNTRMVSGSRPILIGIICALLFLVSFSLSSSMMGLS
ncbi:MAG: type II secretion system F family protein [Candidatus Thorarchaeota archaeon]